MSFKFSIFPPETSSVIVFERPSAPVIKGVNEPLEPVQQGLEPRRQWGEGGGTPVISLLKNRELETETGVCMHVWCLHCISQGINISFISLSFFQLSKSMKSVLCLHTHETVYHCLQVEVQ